MPSQERDEGPKEHHHEEWKAGNSGDMPHLRYENVQDWEGLGRHLNLSVRRKAGYQDRTENPAFLFCSEVTFHLIVKPILRKSNQLDKRKLHPESSIY